MLNSFRYRIVDEKRVFTRYDRIMVDPMATQNEAIKAVDASEYREAIETLRGADLETMTIAEWAKLNAAVEYARKKYRTEILEYMKANPVHMSPRVNEGVICPLLVFHG